MKLSKIFRRPKGDVFCRAPGMGANSSEKVQTHLEDEALTYDKAVLHGENQREARA